jgi:glycerol-3-phosphate dehydrogenase
MSSHLRLALVAALPALGAYSFLKEDSTPPSDELIGIDSPKLARELPRTEAWRLASQPSEDASRPTFDVLVIGGGATGVGCALDAQTRGMKTLLVEKEDFAAGTSSRSTKLVHGGVRYLEKAFKNLDYGQLKLVFEALHERKAVLDSAPHLATPLPIMTPCYAWWEVPYYWAGLKLYDLVAGSENLSWSHFLGERKSKASFPTLSDTNSSGKRLKGSIVYYDGQFNDSRLAVAAACTAREEGAVVLNHAEVISLIHDEESGRVTGAKVRDTLTGRKVDVFAKHIINATGPFADDVRKMSDAENSGRKIIMPSSGVHITLPDYYSPENLGMIVPKTKDGRVVFMLPWLGETIAGTTDAPCEVTMRPKATEEDIKFILDALDSYLSVKVRRSDVKSAWSGIRPLALDPNEQDTSNALRDHVVFVEKDGMVTITGGKWTTYRLMAQDAVDKITDSPCRTHSLKLVGAHGYHPSLFTEVAQSYIVPHRRGAIDTRVAKYLGCSYGDRAKVVTDIAEERKLGKRLVRGYPIIEAEIVYCMKYEMCETPEDFIARRTRLLFLDKQACVEALPRIVDIMATERGWGRWKKRSELKRALEFCDTF